MYVKNIFLSFLFISAVMIAPFSVNANEDLATLRAQEARLAALQAQLDTLKALLAEQRLAIFNTATLADDEGFFPVTVNERMVFACEDKVLTDGEWCVRSLTERLGESYVDLNYIDGFTYDSTVEYDLTLLKERSGTYGQTDTPQYTYSLFKSE